MLPLPHARRSIFLENFTLKIDYLPHKTHIFMLNHTNINYTQNLPKAPNILEKFVPSIFKSECFNKERLPFYEEVKNTEVGHLFEHIMLEYLCIVKLSKGFERAVYTGRTYWDWVHQEPGSFHIKINSGLANIPNFNFALEESASLLDLIFQKRQALARVPVINSSQILS